MSQMPNSEHDRCRTTGERLQYSSQPTDASWH